MAKGKHLRFFGRVHLHAAGEAVKYDLPVIVFEEDGNTICYCPALDIAGYGADEHEAQHSFEITIGEYFSYTLNKKTLRSDLSRLGWHFKKNWKKNMAPPDFSVSLNRNKYFKEIFDSIPFKKINKTIRVPAFA